MVKRNIVLFIISIINWIPALNIMLLREPLSKTMLDLTYLALLICPLIAITSIIIMLRKLYVEKSNKQFMILILIVNVAFLLIGFKYLREVAWII